MCNSFNRFLVGVIGILLALQISAAEKIKLTLTTENYPPFNMIDASGSIVGISTEIVSMLLKRNKIDYKIDIYPWARSMEMAKVNPNTCVFSISRMPERDSSVR